jgi:hypothetical protein
VSFIRGTHVISKNLVGTGFAQPLSLTTGNLAALGDGLIQVYSHQTDPAGNLSGQTQSSFTLDTTPPPQPVLSLGIGIGNGATFAEATQSSGVVTATGEPTADVWVSFSTALATVTKHLIASGLPQPIVLSPVETISLGDGLVTVTASQTDAAGNTQTSAFATTSFILDSTVLPPTLVLGTGVADGANGIEATQTAGVVTVSGEDGSIIGVTFTGFNGTVFKSLSSRGNPQPVILSDAEVLILGDGPVMVSATQTDSVANISTASQRTFTLDILPPSAPVLSLGSGVADGATMAEATQATGVLTVIGELNATITVVMTRGSASLTKIVTGVGVSQPVVLTPAEVSLLGDGIVNVKATQMDSAGNTQRAVPTTIQFQLATAVAAPILSYGTGVANGVTQSEATQAGGVILVQGIMGNTVTVTITGPNGSLNRPPFLANGAQQSIVLTPGELNSLGLGLLTVHARQADISMVSSPTAMLTFLYDSSEPNPATVALGVGVSDGASLNEATQASGVVVVSGEQGAAITVSFATGLATVSKTVVGTGVAQPIVLTATELASLGDGFVAVSASQTDSVGNQQLGPVATTSFRLDTMTPTIVRFWTATANGTYGIGNTVSVHADLNEVVRAGGSLVVTLNTNRTVVLTSGAGGSVLSGTYTIEAGDVTSDLTVISYNQATSTVLDVAGNALSPNATFVDDVAANNNIAIDGSVRLQASAGFSDNASVIPNRKTVVTSLPLVFNTPITGLTKTGISLKRDGRSVSLQRARLIGSGSNYSLLFVNGLNSGPTKSNGIYTVEVSSNGIRAVANGISMTKNGFLYWGRGKSVGISPSVMRSAAFAAPAPVKKSPQSLIFPR